MSPDKKRIRRGQAFFVLFATAGNTGVVESWFISADPTRMSILR